MAQETIWFVGPEGVETAGVAEVVRFSSAGRVFRAAMYVIAGLIGATACILIPIVHLITTWALPLAGIYMAVRTMRVEALVLQPQGVCPQCKQPLELPGGSLNDADWQACPHCKARLQVRIAAAASDKAA